MIKHSKKRYLLGFIYPGNFSKKNLLELIRLKIQNLYGDITLAKSNLTLISLEDTIKGQLIILQSNLEQISEVESGFILAFQDQFVKIISKSGTLHSLKKEIEGIEQLFG